MGEYINLSILILLIVLIIMLFFKRSKNFLIENFKIFKGFFIQQLQFGLKNIIDYLASIELILSKKNPFLNKLFLEDLTANRSINEKNANQTNTYLDALQFAVTNKNVINIALTGGFGTGKSTIINEFCQKNRGNEYLHISLASFKDDKSDEKLIETSIVQQILYYEKKIKIKESSYKRIDFTKPFRKFIFVCLLILWFYTLIFLFFEKINEKLIFFNGIKTNIQLVRFVFIVGVFYIFYKSYDLIKNIKFSKASPSSLEIVNENNDKTLSVFNRNIDEIIYFFEKTNTNIVIVEDIDRFNDDIAIKLYSKIRELSILIKQSKDVIQPVKFIYSVKDELILEDKTKFFDIIIPVIPITDYSNSKNMFLLKLDCFFVKEEVGNELEGESKSYLDKNFISEVSNYVYDMRTVINICNEFKLYNQILAVDKPNIDKNKLFAIIFYKNIFPDDFAQIQKQNSKLHSVFKKDFLNDDNLKLVISEIDDKIVQKNDEISQLKEVLSNQIIKDVKELRTIYIFNLIGMIHEKHNVVIKEIERLNIGYDLTTEENFIKLKTSGNIKINYDYSTDYKTGISFQDVEKNINEKLKYDEREKYITYFHNKRISLLEREIILLSNEKQIIQNLSLFELYKKSSEKINQFLTGIYTTKIYKKVNGVDLLKDEINPNIGLFKYLIKNDYLNEDFIEYVSYFHPGSLSANDHKLMMKINQNEATSFEDKIDNAENLVKSVRDIRFKNQSILIYDLFEFLLKDAQNLYLRNEKLDVFLDQIQSYNDQNSLFIEGFIEKKIDDYEILSNFYVEITKWDSFWNFVQRNFSEDLKRKVLFDILNMFSDEIGNRTLVELNKSKGLTNFINLDKDLLKDIFERINVDSFIKTLQVLHIQFNSITPDEKINDLLLKVYQSDLYQISIDNLNLFSKIDKSYNFTENEFYNSNFSFLKSESETNLYKKIWRSLNQYVETVYLKIEQNVNEKSEDVLYLLEQNDEILSLDNKLKIIKKGFEGKLENYGKIISREIIISLVEENKIVSSWKNIVTYYNQEGPLTSILTNFLNNEENYSILSIAELYENFNLFFKDKLSCLEFIYTFINDEDLSEDSFKEIFKESGQISLESNEVTLESRILFLIENNFIVLDEEEFESLSEKNVDFLVRLIEKNENDFISDLRAYSFEIEFLKKLLESKLSIESLNTIIIERETEIIETENIEILQKIAEFYLQNKSLNFTAEMFDELITSDLEEKYKVSLFNLAVSDEDNEYDISDLLQKMGDKFVNIIKEEGLSLKMTTENEEFLKVLKMNELIKNFKRDNKKEVYNITYA